MLINELIEIIEYFIVMLITAFAFAYFFGWLERKFVGKFQRRHGPTYLGKFGLLQNLADFFKLLTKEQVWPKKADKLLFLVSVFLIAGFTLYLVMLLPIYNFYIINSSIILLLIFIILSFLPILIALNGYSSSNKFAMISAQRSILLLISFEIPLFLVLIAIGYYVHSYSIVSIVNAQSNLWFLFIMPIGFFVFLMALLAEMERTPFDLREADSELIAGWLTDTGAPYYMLALFVDYIRSFFGAAIISLLFLGGWYGPFGNSFIWLFIKTIFVALFIMFIRAIAIRMRIDRILYFGWIVLLALSIINLYLVYLGY